MPGTVTEDIEIIDAGHGGGTGTPAGGDDDSGSPGARRPVPPRAYFTALQLGFAAIVMFFMALASSYIVRKGLGNDWQRTPRATGVWLQSSGRGSGRAPAFVPRKRLAGACREEC